MTMCDNNINNSTSIPYTPMKYFPSERTLKLEAVSTVMKRFQMLIMNKYNYLYSLYRLNTPPPPALLIVEC